MLCTDVFFYIIWRKHMSLCPAVVHTLSNRCLSAFDGSWPGGTVTKHQFHMHVILGSVLTLIMSIEAQLPSTCQQNAFMNHINLNESNIIMSFVRFTIQLGRPFRRAKNSVDVMT